MRKTLILVTAALALLAAPSRAEENCSLVKIASFAMRMDDAGFVTIPLKIGGREVRMLVDTGGVYTGISQSVAEELGLDIHYLNTSFHTVMYGGKVIDHYVNAPNVEYGPFVQPRNQFVVMPKGSLPSGADGLLAPDILRGFDVDFDFAGGVLNLFSPDHCPGRVVYWTQSPVAVLNLNSDESFMPRTKTGEIPGTTPEGLRHVKVWMKLDDQDVEALIDTGASNTTFSLERAQRMFGFDKSAPDLKEVGERVYSYPFKSLTISGLQIGNPRIALIPDKDSTFYGGPMLLGMNVLHRLHLYLSYKEGKLYISPAEQH